MFKKFFSKTCFFCGKKSKDTTPYLNDGGETVHVCFQCVPVAERRALRKK
ncbi:hypothetical protein Bsel_1956 [[Bacillus] selenitireducens MLS10]|uniref:Uncharacterized protein n=1 Tax=Bacillus selenitireducens (strain ATCC 700615 / DSM 15326 / MLS10) TaxID=439292 RepID=D6XUH4_BACIE|nr:ClpX C4-type zinc finger protein [Salisediminibacterium selenitireducens]ADH99460.1 hypothetical protein Bsel_1956 [[Bacillus] selenitireducens MLS10]